MRNIKTNLADESKSINNTKINTVADYLAIFYIYKSECVSVCMFKINSLTP